MTSAAKHTAGPMRRSTEYPLMIEREVEGIADGYDGYVVAETKVHSLIGRVEAAANADLIADTFNLAHETGLTPRQLAEQRDELLAALRNITECAEAEADGANMDLWIMQARAAIAKAEGGAA